MRELEPQLIEPSKYSACFLALLFSAVLGVAQEFSCETNSGTITITGYSGPETVTIPSTIHGLTVTGIANGAFFDSLLDPPGPTSVAIPASVTNIDSGAFKYCVNLNAITVDPLNPAYTSVDGALFSRGQTVLIRFPAGKLVTSCTIPESVTRIGDNALEYCFHLNTITIPNSVTKIGDNAFAWCAGLTSIVLPDHVTAIGINAFSYCSSLTGITLPQSLVTIGDGALAGCPKLTSIAIPSGVVDIGVGVFQSCTSLISVTVPDSVTLIGDHAFDGCASLASIGLGKGVSCLGSQAFDSCSSLTNVFIPAGVTNIGAGPFARCPSLLDITVDPLNLCYTSVDGILFNKDRTTLVQYPGARAGGYVLFNGVTGVGGYAFAGCTRLTRVALPYGVTRIESSTFDTCTNLTGVNIPGTVTSIGDAAFLNCFNLTNVTIPGGVLAIGGSAFADCTNMAGIYFMGNAPSLGDDYGFASDYMTTAFYLPGTTGWGATIGNIPTAPWRLPYPVILANDRGVQNNEFGFTVSWATNLSLVVEASTDLTFSKWQPLRTNALAGGSFYFSDPGWTNNPARFYRVRSP